MKVKRELRWLCISGGNITLSSFNTGLEKTNLWYQVDRDGFTFHIEVSVRVGPNRWLDINACTPGFYWRTRA